MSGRFVRASKYRHVHGEPAKKDKGCYLNVKPQVSGDSRGIAVNAKYLAFPSSGGGGPVVVRKVEDTGKLPMNPFKLNVHTGNVLDLAFSPFVESLLATSSDDGTVKLVVMPDELEDGKVVSDAVANLVGHEKKVNLLALNPAANSVLASSSHDGTVKVWDMEKQSANLTYKHDAHAVSVEWNSNGSLLGLSLNTKKMTVVDPRQSDAAQVFDGFTSIKPAKCTFVDSLGWFYACGAGRNGRTQMIWDLKKLDKPLATAEVDMASGVLFPHYDPDTSMMYLAGRGDGNIRYYELVAEAPYIHGLSEYRTSEPQKGVGFVPKRACDTTKCEVACGYRLMRDYIQPVSFQVPRKSDMFQSDIYPDTYAGKPALNQDQWFEGKNGEPEMVSMKPGEGGKETAAASFVAQKSRAELEAELVAANARIAELEAQLKAA